MPLEKRMKPAVASATGGLHIVEQFGRPLGIQDIAALDALQSIRKHVIFVTPIGRGRYEVRYGDATETLLTSRQPLLDAARLLLALGCKPDAQIVMRRRASQSDDLRAQLCVAARYTVDESKTAFAIWKPFSRSAVSRTNGKAKGRQGE